MACRLGQCRADAYRVIVRDRRGPEIMELDFLQLDWDRRLDEVSEAVVQLKPSAACCGRMSEIEPWRHELSISRDSVEQWVGPIRVQPSCTSGLVLKATDVLGWTERRVIHEDHDWSNVDIGAVQAAVELIRDGYAPDDPNVLKYLTQFGTGVLGGRVYTANSQYVIDALKALAQGSIDFTTIGRRIVIMPAGYELGRTPMLTCDHFADDLCTTVDGDAYASRAVVTGVAVTGTAGGVDPYYGLVEVLKDDQAIGRQSTADGAAAGLLNGKQRVPVVIQSPAGGSGFAPDAPLCLDQLVPGITVPVSINCTCRTATQDMRLTQLKVSVTAEGETIAPLLVPVGFDTAA